jgi:nucleoid-associated protein YgaU
MANTRSKLVAAQIIEVNSESPFGDKIGGLSVPCHFNPFEYTISKTNSYKEIEATKPKNGSQGDFQKSGPQSLKLTLTFDTYEEGENVSQITNDLWKFMKPKANGGDPKDKESPPAVAFVWGVFRFVAVITNMTQKFTLFTKDGIPVRAKVDVTFTQYFDVDDYPNQNPTSGGGPVQRLWPVVRGDRLDLIAAEVYGDATKWRAIAEYNGIINPLRLHPGQHLIIPSKP